MIKVCVCDDEQFMADEISNILNNIADKKGINIEVEVFYNGYTFLNTFIQNKASYNLIFLDIEMEDVNGIEIAKQLRKMDELVYIIYVTSHVNYAVEAYDVHPFQFVVKPFDKGVIERHFLDIYRRIESSNMYYEIKLSSKYIKLLTSQIMYFESDKRKVNVYMSDGVIYSYYDTLDNIEGKFSGYGVGFWRVHQSFLINSRYIIKKTHEYIYLMNDVEIPISKKRQKEISKKYIEQVEGYMKNGNNN